MKRRLFKIAQLAALVAAVFCSTRVQELLARPPEVAVGGPEGAPNLTQDKTLKLIAQWPNTNASGTAMTRYYVLDYDNGQNSPGCYQDAQTGATLTGARACKTFDFLLTILPKWGNGRSLVILVRPRTSGATYRNTANTQDAVFDLSGLAGYSRVIVRGSATLLNDVTDRKRVGGIIASAGPGGSQEWTCAAGATTTTLTVSAGALPADLTAAGLRARFTGNVTVGLTDVSRPVHSSLAGTLTFTTVGTACANGDTFFLEKPGVAVASISVGSWGTLENGSEVVGIRTTASTDGLKLGVATGQYIFAFLHVDGTGNDIIQTQSGGNSGSALMTHFYVDEGGAALTVGGLRFSGNLLLRWSANLLVINSSALLAQSSRSLDLLGPTQLQMGNSGAVTVAGGILLTSCGGVGASAGSITNTPIVIGRALTATIPKTRLLGLGITFAAPLESSGCAGALAGADITGSTYAIELSNIGGTWRVSDTASTETTAGIGIAGSIGSKLIIDTGTSTFTGGSGAVEFQGPVYTTTAGLALSNVLDARSNDVQSTVLGAVVGQAIAVSNQSGGALGVGTVVKSNGTSVQVTNAKADTSAASAAIFGVMVTPPASGALGYMVAVGTPYMLFDGAPTVGAIAYLSPGTAGKATTTVPAVAGTNQKVRIGRVISASGSTGYVSFAPDWLAVVADGNP